MSAVMESYWRSSRKRKKVCDCIVLTFHQRKVGKSLNDLKSVRRDEKKFVGGTIPRQANVSTACRNDYTMKLKVKLFQVRNICSFRYLSLNLIGYATASLMKPNLMLRKWVKSTTNPYHRWALH
ncbi:hypothetical protein CEXT_117551 [Caerostris extrusa]|uniref:Uncharacterized protein n=1 Tax=Caerostris extrusa TaxID=172846 RepID=A0AAV4QX04_CAEEX|nr:hypothetical protein CEXT_117551 [Caerostris extrusa]